MINTERTENNGILITIDAIEDIKSNEVVHEGLAISIGTFNRLCVSRVATNPDQLIEVTQAKEDYFIPLWEKGDGALLGRMSERKTIKMIVTNFHDKQLNIAKNAVNYANILREKGRLDEAFSHAENNEYAAITERYFSFIDWRITPPRDEVKLLEDQYIPFADHSYVSWRKDRMWKATADKVK